MTEEPTTTPPAEQSPADAILEATLRLIGESGLQAVRHRRVAELAGVSLGAIPNHFPTRDILLLEALRLEAHRDTARVEEFATIVQAQSWDTQTWSHVIAAALAHDVSDEPVRRLTAFELLLASARDLRLRDLMDEWTAAYQRFAEIGFRAGGSPTPELHARILVVVLSGAVLSQMAVPQPNFEREILRPQVVELVSKLLSA
jgi:DNA-binding transcriptional regulator YbjK